MSKVIIRPYFKKNGTSVKLSTYITRPFAGFVTYGELRELIKDAGDFELDLSGIENAKTKGPHRSIRDRAKAFDPCDFLINFLKQVEMDNGEADDALLKRIIMNGGLSHYAKMLEERACAKM